MLLYIAPTYFDIVQHDRYNSLSMLSFSSKINNKVLLTQKSLNTLAVYIWLKGSVLTFLYVIKINSVLF